MKAYTRYNIYRLTILSIIIIITATGCSLTRRLGEREALVRKITFKGIDKQYQLVAPNYIDKEQQPNNWLNLQFYYMFSNHGKRDIGEPPRLLDTNLVEFSRLQMERFLINKGYLNAKVAADIKIKDKRAELVFTANEGPLYRIAKLQDSIADPVVKQLFNNNRSSFSHVKVGNAYDTDSLAYDRDQIFQLLKRNGYYDFYRQYIYYEYDTVKHAVNLKMLISNPDGKDRHPVYTINNTVVTISNSNGRLEGKPDTMKADSQFTFVDYSHKFSPKPITNYIFQKKGDLYNIDQQTLTTTRLSELSVFRNVPNPTFTKTADSTNRLNSRIDIIPLKHFSDRIEGEYIFNSEQQGFNIGNTFTNRNLFKGAEILQLKLSWSVLFDGTAAIQNQDFKAGFNLIYPRIIAPFPLPIPGKFGVPHTTISSNYQLFYQKDISRKSFINSLTYDWAESTNRLHSLTPIDIEFTKGIINSDAQRELDSLGLHSYVYLINRPIFSSGSQYSYQFNANKLYSLGTFKYFRAAFDVGGNTLSLISKLTKAPKDTDGFSTMFGQTFAQYVKGEFDFRWYHNLGGNREIVFRFNPGIGVPYGNSHQLIFEKNFYAGGSNDIRAWLPRTLGPGQFNRSVYPNDTIRKNLLYLDQFGQIKITGNVEYRYNILDNFFGSKLDGALFADFGNVWSLNQQSGVTYNGKVAFIQPNGVFDIGKLWDATAIGIGTGLRFDLAFFVFRFDAAFKFKDPQFTGADQWVILRHPTELLHAGSFKADYQRTNYLPYSFMQLNFGIGLPF